MKKEAAVYFMIVFGIAIALYVIISSIFKTRDATISFFLSLICSILIMDKYDELTKD